MTEAVQITQHLREQLPPRRYGETFELRHGGKRAVFHVTLGRYPDGHIGEVFVSGGKSGTEIEANVRHIRGSERTIVPFCLGFGGPRSWYHSRCSMGFPIATMAAAITREGDGSASTVIGVVLDKLMLEGGQP